MNFTSQHGQTNFVLVPLRGPTINTLTQNMTKNRLLKLINSKLIVKSIN